MGTHTISNTATLHGWLESVGLDDFLANPGWVSLKIFPFLPNLARMYVCSTVPNRGRKRPSGGMFEGVIKVKKTIIYLHVEVILSDF